MHSAKGLEWPIVVPINSTTKPVVSKNTNELKTSSRGRFGLGVSTLDWPMGVRILAHEHAGPPVLRKKSTPSCAKTQPF